jgi:type IV secretory pathway VirB2 component (pilin)
MTHKHDYLKIAITVLAVIFFTLAALPSFAATTATTPLPMDQPLRTIREFFTGTFAWTVSLVSLVISLAMLAFGSDFNGTARTFLLAALILSAIVFANNLYTSLFSGAVIPL